MKKLKSKSGITLIALVITILVLLILAGVSITALTDDEKGIVTKAKEASEKTETASTQEDEDISEILDYEEIVTATPVKLSSNITSANYGDSINYSANGIDDWKIFYNDGNNVFIIASDYLESDKLPDDVKMDTLEDYPYSACWLKDTSTLNDITETINTSVANKYVLDWLNDYPNSTNDNIKAISALMNTSVWDVFVDTKYASSAIGSPTLDMFALSWNAKYGSVYSNIFYDVRNENGYYLATSANSTNNSSYISLSQQVTKNEETGEYLATGYYDTLYFPHTTTYNTCNGYWLAGPSTYVYESQTTPTYIYCSGIIGASQGGCCGTGDTATAGADFSVRPVVCLKDTAKATKTVVDGKIEWILD